jgi:ketosteroid isomerase-like protein
MATNAAMNTAINTNDEQTIKTVYDLFNSRDIDGVFNHLVDDVAWANGMEGTHVHGKKAVREYWTHQWSVIDPHVTPLKTMKANDSSLLVEVHQVVKDLQGTIVLDEKIVHRFTMNSGRIVRFDIPSESKLSSVKY